jgi:hypothetical protein
LLRATDEEFHDGNPVYATHNMKAFIDENALTQEEFDRDNPRKEESTTATPAKSDNVAMTGV